MPKQYGPCMGLKVPFASYRLVSYFYLYYFVLPVFLRPIKLLEEIRSNVYSQSLNSQPRIMHFWRCDWFTESRLSAHIPQFDLIWEGIELTMFFGGKR